MDSFVADHSDGERDGSVEHEDMLTNLIAEVRRIVSRAL
jgi:hypothetical protein